MNLRLLLFFVFCYSGVFSQNAWTDNFIKEYQEVFDRKYFVDSVFMSMNDDERLGQLFMIAAYSNKDEKHFLQLDSLVKKYHVGGLIFFQGGPYRQAHMTNYFQSVAKTPLFIAIDGEWGLNMRLDSTIQFPHQLTLGAISDNTLIYEMGRTIAKECRRIGVHINFAPVIDVNNNAKNPVINDRSFGEDKINVALKGLAYAKGLQDVGVMACAKHFPGHGDTDNDSHYSLPVINKTRAQLDTLELYPFKVLFNEGVHSIMAAHLFIPSIDSTKNLATSLSYNSTTQLLKNEMNFKGLVFSDALNMKGVSKFFKPGEVEVKAFKAGNDVLLFAEDVPKAVSLFKKAIADNEISKQDIDVAVKKILAAKYDYGVFLPQQIALENLYEDLNNKNAQLLNRLLFEKALTVAKDDEALLPFKNLEQQKFASVSIGKSNLSEFREMLDNYAPFNHFSAEKNAKPEIFKSLTDSLKNYSVVVIALNDMLRQASKNYGLTDAAINFIKEISSHTKVVLNVFGNPYSLKNFESCAVVVCAYEDNEINRAYVPQLLFGAIGADATLPVSSSEVFVSGKGLMKPAGLRLKFTIPEEVGIDSKKLLQIDSIVMKMMGEKMAPGCQIVFAKEGKVFYQKSFGYHTYDCTAAVKNSDIYDVASVTKIAATTVSLMKLYDEEKFSLDKNLADYLALPKDNTVGHLKTKDVLLHKAGLQAWIPFYLRFSYRELDKVLYRSKPEKGFDVRVGNTLYTNSASRDTIFNMIVTAKTESKPEYKYSDLGFYLFADIIKNISGKRIDTFSDENFYAPLGLRTTTYNPLNKFPSEIIPPTEEEKTFRKELVHGYVHDPGAALLGGVSGHAGLFSNATNLAVLMQMLLNKGSYGGQPFLKPETVELFTAKHNGTNRRGLGFDKPEPDTTKGGPAAKSASVQTFGHTGFTGTSVWADPQHQLVYVFLSNRVHPDASNNKLASKNIRTDIMQVVYDALLKKN